MTRANEARRTDFTAQVQGEHAAIVAAIANADPAQARAAAEQHMNNAIARIESADPAFWHQEGEPLPKPLVPGLRSS